jgi:hypothetical protein
MKRWFTIKGVEPREHVSRPSPGEGLCRFQDQFRPLEQAAIPSMAVKANAQINNPKLGAHR